MGRAGGSFHVRQGRGAVQRLPFIAGVGGIGLSGAALNANAAGILWGTGEASGAGYPGSIVSGTVHSPSAAAEGEPG